MQGSECVNMLTCLPAGADPGNSVVSVEQFKTYVSCLDPRAEPLCEPGANATESTTPGRIRDITSKVRESAEGIRGQASLGSYVL